MAAVIAENDFRSSYAGGRYGRLNRILIIPNVISFAANYRQPHLMPSAIKAANKQADYSKPTDLAGSTILLLFHK